MTATDRARQIVAVAAQAAADKLAQNIVAYDVSDTYIVTDAFMLASAPNDRQVRAIADGIEDALREQLDAKPASREGEREGRWILLDYLDVVFHIQHAEERSYYRLERLWKDCPELALPADAEATRKQAAEDADGALPAAETAEFAHVEAVLAAEAAERSRR